MIARLLLPSTPISLKIVWMSLTLSIQSLQKHAMLEKA